jgi:hypothetical protein
MEKETFEFAIVFVAINSHKRRHPYIAGIIFQQSNTIVMGKRCRVILHILKYSTGSAVKSVQSV